MAGVKGLEPSTYRVTGDRSNQLSYTPTFVILGWLAQLVEHLVYTENVSGSSPLTPRENSLMVESWPVTPVGAGSNPVFPDKV